MRAELGVIGGIGPMATAYFLERVVAMTQAKSDQDHIPMIIYNHTDIPDRTAFILGRSEADPQPFLIEDAQALEAAGCSAIAIPCNTAFYFYDAFEEMLSIPVIHIVRATVAYAKDHGASRLGILATDGTLETGVYQKEADAQGIEFLLPSKESQAQVMAMIYDGVKAGQAVDKSVFDAVADELRRAGADCLILACTELSVLKRDLPIEDGDVLDALDVLARASVLHTGRSLTAVAELMEGSDEI